jgi:hypothetical protein
MAIRAELRHSDRKKAPLALPGAEPAYRSKREELKRQAPY